MTNREWLNNLTNKEYALFLYHALNNTSNCCHFLDLEERYCDHCWDYGACIHWCIKDWLDMEHWSGLDLLIEE